ncbi:hypothetical protein M6D81_15420 [Paenibacillus sp. J5C_2022]|uniref:hypothetical protein n=1 Tax=Paenibacillus sp. J5C2022 TaxID=2977129 RepID=UPI0021D34C51|nr:hypothetical protein [Paenibacillus sp. J5C2022]MCU6710086.1 hypothetical protein [Paenibacillus sp. J5C2022]
MAVIGDVLTSPESGWARYNDNDVNISYIDGNSEWKYGNDSSGTAGYWQNDIHTYTGSTSDKGSMKFNFTGTKIRLICRVTTSYAADNSISIDGVVENFSTNNNQNVSRVLVYEKIGLEDKEHYVEVKNGDGQIVLDAIDIETEKTLYPYKVINNNKTLIFKNDEYITYVNDNWSLVNTSLPTETQFIDSGINDLSIIPESAWSQLTGDIEICYYSDDPNKNEVAFNIETEPFTLYDEFGDSMDILYYTDDPTVTEPKLEITANYSPIDELDGDFEVVTWTNGQPEEVNEPVESVYKEASVDGDLYRTTIDLSKGTKRVEGV